METWGHMLGTVCLDQIAPLYVVPVWFLAGTRRDGRVFHWGLGRKKVGNHLDESLQQLRGAKTER